MSEPLRAELVDMHLSARQVDEMRSDSSELFARNSSRVESAASGWVGESASALMDAVGKLQKSHASITTRLAGHSENISSAAHAFQEQDGATQDALRRIDPGAAQPRLNLDV